MSGHAQLPPSAPEFRPNEASPYPNLIGDKSGQHHRPIDPHGRFLKLDDVKQMIGLSRSAIYRMLQTQNHPFPQPIKIGTGARWLEVEVIRWKTEHVRMQRESIKQDPAGEDQVDGDPV